MLNKKIEIKGLFKGQEEVKKNKYSSWRIISMFITGLLIASVFLIAYFVYQNIYLTLSNSYAIIVLSNDLGVDQVDVEMYNKVENILEIKNTPVELDANLRNVFEYQINTNTTSTTSTIDIE